MGKYLFEMFGVSLGLTLVIEGIAAWIWGIRKKKQLMLTGLANIMTNPPAVFLAWVWRLYFPEEGKMFFYLVVELAVVFTEGYIYKKYLQEMKHPLLFSFFANGCSFLLGLFAG